MKLPLAPIATARNAVPLLWLSLFRYEDFQLVPTIERHRAECVGAHRRRHPAQRRTRRTNAAHGAQACGKRGSVGAAEAAKRRLPSARLSLDGHDLLQGMSRDVRDRYVSQLILISDLWDQLRNGADWEDVQAELLRLGVDLSAVLAGSDADRQDYTLAGSVELPPPAAEHLVRCGQGQRRHETPSARCW